MRVSDAKLTTSTGRRWRPRDHLLSAVVLVCGAALAVTASYWAQGKARARELENLERRAHNITVALGASLETWVEVAHHVESFFHSSDDVTRLDFHDFVGPALGRHPEIAALEWFPLTAAAQRAALEEHAHQDGLLAYGVRELGAGGRLVSAGQRDFYLPLLYMEPMDDGAMGLDVYGAGMQRVTADAARDGHTPVVTPRLRLVEDPPDVYAVALYVPIYKRGQLLETLEQRRAAFAGVVVELFRTRPIFQRALAELNVRGLGVVVRDLSAKGEAQVLYESATGLAQEEMPASVLRWRQELPFAGRRWELSFVAERDILLGGALQTTVLSFGFLISLVAAGLLSSWKVIQRLRRDVAEQRSLGQYQLMEKIGEGGIGEVWKARHALLRRPTAVKILSHTRALEADYKRFEREVQLTAGLTHPNTVIVFDYGRTRENTFYYAMEYIEGINLETLVANEGPQPPGRVVRFLEQTCGALAEAHAAGLIHRDVKPSNLMLCQRGGISDVIKVLDFGMVKERGVVSDVSETGISYGTPLYLAPEAITRPNAIDGRADLYAVGLVGYFLLSGKRAVQGATLADVLHQHTQVSPEPPSLRLGKPVPPALERLIMSCLAKDPEDRPASAAAMRDALLALTDVPEWTQAQAGSWWLQRTPVGINPTGASGPSR